MHTVGKFGTGTMTNKACLIFTSQAEYTLYGPWVTSIPVSVDHLHSAPALILNELRCVHLHMRACVSQYCVEGLKLAISAQYVA